MNKPVYEKPFELRPDTGSLRKSDSKYNQESPDYFGSFRLALSSVQIVDGEVEFKLSGWKSVDRSGKSYLSLKLNNWKDTAKAADQPKTTEEQNDDFPF